MWATARTVLAAQVPNPMDSIRKLPGYRGARDTVTLLSPARIEQWADLRIEIGPVLRIIVDFSRDDERHVGPMRRLKREMHAFLRADATEEQREISLRRSKTRW